MLSVADAVAGEVAEDALVVDAFADGSVPSDLVTEEFFADAAAEGLTPQLTLAGWDVRPWSPDSEFLVTVLGAAAAFRERAAPDQPLKRSTVSRKASLNP